MEQISSLYLKELAKLKQKKYREEMQKTVVEGARIVRQLLDNRQNISALFIQKDCQEEHREIIKLVEDKTPVFLLEDWQLEKITDTQTPQNIAALVPLHSNQLTAHNFVLYLENIADPGNFGTIIRTAAAAGMDGIVVSCNSCEIYNPKTVRASMGTVFSLPITVDNGNYLDNFEGNKIATVVDPATTPLSDFVKNGQPTVIIIGSEADGISPALLGKANYQLHIPMHTLAESLNASVAAGIFIFALKP